MKAANSINPVWPVLVIILIGGILRFWNLERLTTFSGDQGYDFLIVKRMIVDHDFTLLGPKIGPYNQIGNLYLGPVYYYLLAPALFIFKLDPLGPAVLTVLLSILTIFFIYQFSARFLSTGIAILSSTIYGLNSFLINQSRAASNPHLMPFFSITFIYSILEILHKKQQRKFWPVVAGISLGIMFQLHYLAVSMIPILSLLMLRKKISSLLILTVSFLAAVSPQILFEIRNKFFITKLFIAQMQSGENVSTSGKLWEHLTLSLEKLSNIFLSPHIPTIILIVLMFIALFQYRAKNLKSTLTLPILTLISFSGIIFASLYSGSIEPHYFVAIYPAIAIIIGTVILFFMSLSNNFLIQAVIILIPAQIISTNILNLNLNSPQGYTMPQGWNLTGAKKAAKIISKDIEPSKTFNIASTLDGDTRARPLRYLTEVYGHKPNNVEHYPDSERIYLVSRDEEETVKRYTVWEISSFRPFKFEKKWEIQNGINVYKLTKQD